MLRLLTAQGTKKNSCISRNTFERKSSLRTEKAKEIEHFKGPSVASMQRV